MISLIFSNCKLEAVKACVQDFEAVAWDRDKKQIQPFQVLSTRKRKDASESEIKVQVAVFAFDLLYLNGEALVKKSFEVRRKLLKEHFKEVEGEFIFAKSADPETVEEVQELLEESVKGNVIICVAIFFCSVLLWYMYSDLSLNNSSKSLDQTSGKTGNFRYIYCIQNFFLLTPQNCLG